MSVGRPPGTNDLARVLTHGANAPAAPDAPEIVDDHEIVPAGGHTPALDLITLSARAWSLVRAGLAVRAFVMTALTRTYRTLVLRGRTVILEFGVYR
ncbi:MAG TPA: hypothetical protein VKF82_07245 [Candidatus Eremiobacteraceae bacterium]|nr:hypothetical protein [Candidatus Eremiobacteraceae bacterium]